MDTVAKRGPSGDGSLEGLQLEVAFGCAHLALVVATFLVALVNFVVQFLNYQLADTHPRADLQWMIAEVIAELQSQLPFKSRIAETT